MDFRLDIWKIRSTTSITTIQLRFSSTRSRFSLDCSLGYCVVQHSSLTTREIKCVEQFWNKILSEEVFLFHRMSACSEDLFLLTVPWTPESMNVCLDIRNVFLQLGTLFIRFTCRRLNPSGGFWDHRWHGRERGCISRRRLRGWAKIDFAWRPESGSSAYTSFMIFTIHGR